MAPADGLAMLIVKTSAGHNSEPVIFQGWKKNLQC